MSREFTQDDFPVDSYLDVYSTGNGWTNLRVDKHYDGDRGPSIRCYTQGNKTFYRSLKWINANRGKVRKVEPAQPKPEVPGIGSTWKYKYSHPEYTIKITRIEDGLVHYTRMYDPKKGYSEVNLSCSLKNWNSTFKPNPHSIQADLNPTEARIMRTHQIEPCDRKFFYTTGETTMSNVSRIEKKYFYKGTDIATMSEDKVIQIIRDMKERIESLKAVGTKSKVIKRQIKQLKKDLAKFIQLTD